jgi:hypothetical protein
MACSFQRGVRVRINDDAVEPSHIEYAKCFDAAASCDCYLPKSNAYNGTAVASIVGVSANNNFCAVDISMGQKVLAADIQLQYTYPYFVANLFF